MTFSGPGEKFEVLFEEEVVTGSLPTSLQEIYGGNWDLTGGSGRPYSYSNFVMSHDGKVSFNVPGHEGGGDVSGFNRHDQWFMALARSQADAVVVGANTLRTEFEHEWTAEFIFPDDADAFAKLRSEQGRTATPLQVIVTQSGEVRPDAKIFMDPRFEVMVATSDSGKAKLSSVNLPNAKVVSFGAEVDIPRLYATLQSEFGCKTVLCEGGPRLYASVVLAGQLDEEFLTLSPVVVGSSAAELRPSLLDGVALPPGNPLRAKLKSVRRAGDYLFLRTRWS